MDEDPQSGWTKRWSRKRRMTYFFNSLTGESIWARDDPKECQNREKEAKQRVPNGPQPSTSAGTSRPLGTTKAVQTQKIPLEGQNNSDTEDELVYKKLFEVPKVEDRKKQVESSDEEEDELLFYKLFKKNMTENCDSHNTSMRNFQGPQNGNFEAGRSMPKKRVNFNLESDTPHENLKRKISEHAETSYHANNSTTRRLMHASHKLQKLSDEGTHGTTVKSNESNFPKGNGLLTGKSKTPIQDRYNRSRHQLLRKQNLNNSEVSPGKSFRGSSPTITQEEKNNLLNKRDNETSLPIVANKSITEKKTERTPNTIVGNKTITGNRTFGTSNVIENRRDFHNGRNLGRFKTPIQDKYSKKKEELIRNQLTSEKNVDTTTIRRPRIHDRIGFKQTQKLEEPPPPNNVPGRGFKRTAPSSQAQKLEEPPPPNNVPGRGFKRTAPSSQGSYSNGWRENEPSPKTFKRSFSPDKGGVKRFSLDSGLPDKNISLDGDKRFSLESGVSDKTLVSLGGVKRNNCEFGIQDRNSVSSSEERRTSINGGLPNKVGNRQTHFGSSDSSIQSSPFACRTRDLRLKLQQRSKEVSPCADVPCQMDWSPTDPSTSFQHEIGRVDGNQNEVPAQVSRPNITNIYLVCDTSALVEDHVFFEKLITNGSFLNLPITLVMPGVVWDELDCLKVKEGDVGFKAREVSRILKSNLSSKHLILQDGSKTAVAVEGIQLINNDALVVNCALQTRQTCKDTDLVMLITKDTNQGIKADSFKITHNNWFSFRAWARKFREYRPNCSKGIISLQGNINEKQLREDEKMEVDTSPSNLNNRRKPFDDSRFKRKVNLETEHNTSPPECNLGKNTLLQNCIKSHLHELKSEFQTFLHNILQEAIERAHGHFKEYTNNIRPSWRVMDYIVEIRRRWNLITDSYLSNEDQAILGKLTATIKKSNSDDELTIEDVHNHFNLCIDLAKILSRKSQKPGNSFITTARHLQQEWKEAYSISSSRSQSQNLTEEDVQPVDVAFQNIYNYLHSHYEDLQTQNRTSNYSKHFEQHLGLLDERVSYLLSLIKSTLKEKVDSLSCKNEKIQSLYKNIAYFSGIEECPIGFEIVLENVVELFQDMSYRKIVREKKNKFEELEMLVKDLIKSVCD